MSKLSDSDTFCLSRHLCSCPFQHTQRFTSQSTVLIPLGLLCFSLGQMFPFCMDVIHARIVDFEKSMGNGAFAPQMESPSPQGVLVPRYQPGLAAACSQAMGDANTREGDGYGHGVEPTLVGRANRWRLRRACRVPSWSGAAKRLRTPPKDRANTLRTQTALFFMSTCPVYCSTCSINTLNYFHFSSVVYLSVETLRPLSDCCTIKNSLLLSGIKPPLP